VSALYPRLAEGQTRDRPPAASGAASREARGDGDSALFAADADAADSGLFEPIEADGE
jgi:hypothetical protein